MNTKKILFWAALPLLGACSTADEQEGLNANDGRVPVTLTAETVQAVQTRAGAGASQTLNVGYLTTGDVVKVGIRNYDSSDTEDFTDYSFTVTNATGAMSVTGGSATPYYPTDNDGRIDLIAYYPSTAASPFTVKADQSTDANYRASDLLYEKKTNLSRTTDAVALQLDHLMAKLTLNITAGEGVSYIKSITMTNVVPSCTFDAKTGAVAATGSAGTISVFTDGDNDNTTARGACVFPGQEIAATGLLEIVVQKTDGNSATATYALASAKTFDGGSEYTMNITVNRTALGTTNTLTGWDATGKTVNVCPQTLTFTVGGATFTMVYVEGTENDIAMNWDDRTSGASYNRHPVTVQGITGYYIGQTEVNNKLWYAVMGSKPTVWSASGQNNGQPNNGDAYPVAWVSYDDICTASTGFLDLLNTAAASQLPAGMAFVLPSEVQWQYAAIGGARTKGYTYSGSSNWGDTAWEGDNSGTTTHPVATKPANELGLYDMSGNVWEWCRDLYATVTDNQVLAKDYVGESGSTRVIRGGCWGNTSSHAAYFYPSFRVPYAASAHYCSVGFRLALQFTD